MDVDEEGVWRCVDDAILHFTNWYRRFVTILHFTNWYRRFVMTHVAHEKTVIY